MTTNHTNPFDLTRQWPDRSGQPGQHTTRPWWWSDWLVSGGTCNGGRWLRSDGRSLYLANRWTSDEAGPKLTEYDREHPLPCPPPLDQHCVDDFGAWVHVERVQPLASGMAVVSWSDGQTTTLTNSDPTSWVRGPILKGCGAPWADTTEPLPWEAE